MYHFIDRLHTLYGLLQDEQSKEIFQARFAVDMELSTSNVRRLVSLGACRDRSILGEGRAQKDLLKKLNREQKQIILYGTSDTGRIIAGMLQSEHIGFYGFCGRRPERYPDGLLGKPVLSPDALVSGEEYYIVPAVTAEKSRREIFQFLREHNYPEDHILDLVAYDPRDEETPHYFEFPALYRKGTAFIDGGCYDCTDSYRFAEWCGGAYSSILAFEPDPGNFAKCREKVRDVPLPNIQLFNAGLSGQEGTALFDAENAMSSRIILTESDISQAKRSHGDQILVRTAAIDDIVGERTVGFIKMDIEGAEFDALHGAKNTIVRDKPLLAISVYHLQGDLFAIMDYLHQILPEYRFCLRHYGTLLVDTILYASVDL